MNKKYYKKALVYICIAISIVIFVLQYYRHQNIDLSFNTEDVYYFTDFWYYDQDGKKFFVDLPAKIPVEDSGSATVFNTFPEKIVAGSSIKIRTSWQSIIVKSGDDIIYEWGNDEAYFRENKLVSHWNLIRIPTEYAGREFSITLDSPYNQFIGSFDDITYGSKSSLIYDIVETRWGHFLISIFILFLAIVFFGLYSMFYNLKYNNNKSLLYLAYLHIVAGIWLLGESQTLQFFTGNYEINSSIAFYALLIIPMITLLFVESVMQSQSNLLISINKTLLFIQFIVILILDFYNIYGFMEILWFVNLMLLLTFVNITINLIYEMLKYKNLLAKQNFISIFALLIAGSLEIIRVNFFNLFEPSQFVNIGILVSIIIFSQISFVKIKANIKHSKELAEYEKLAFRDVLTSGYNYNAYQKELDLMFEKNKGTNKQLEIWCIIFDLNNLKLINDKFGHNEGDFAIKFAYATMARCLSKYGKTFRVGGDEFISILTNCSKRDIDAGLNELTMKVEARNTKSDYKISIAYGYDEFIGNTREEFEKHLATVDKKMYEHKMFVKKIKP